MCVIDGGLFASGASNPDDLGECCNAAVSADTWLPRFLATGAPMPGSTIDVVASDFNRDGVDDLAAISLVDGRAQLVILFAVDGGFDAKPQIVDFPAGTSPEIDEMLALDLDRDGAPDLLVPVLNGIDLIRNRGDGTFEPPQTIEVGLQVNGVVPLPAAAPSGTLTLGVVASLQSGDGGKALLVGVKKSDAGLALLLQAEVFTEGDPWSPSFVDVSKPEAPALVFEVATARGNDVQEIGVENGELAAVQSPIPNSALTQTPSINGMAVGDVNGDGFDDLVASNFFESSVSIALGDGRGGFGDWIVLPLGSNANGRPVLADFDGSGKLAIAVPDSLHDVAVYWPLSDGGFALTNSTGLTGPFDFYVKRMVTANFNGDGAIDLAGTAADGANFAPAVAVFYNACP